MLKNFLTITLRGLLRNWNYTIINVIGLGVGLACCIVIFLIIRFELQFDKFHTHYDKIYRVVSTSESNSGIEHSAVVPYPFIAGFRNDFPDIPLSTQFHIQDESQLAYGTDKMSVENILFADSLFFNVFSFELISGNPRVEMAKPGKVILTESLAKKIMKDGEKTRLKLGNQIDLEIVGIVKDPPPSSHMNFSMLVSYPSLSEDFLGLPIDNWGMTIGGLSYMVLPDNIRPEDVEQRFQGFVKKYYSSNSTKKRAYALQPLSAIHFSELYNGNPLDVPGLTRSSLMVLALLGAFILLVACINFINLSTALAVKRSREIGVRKTLGAKRNELTQQFLLEAFQITLCAAIVAICLVEISITSISTFLHKQLSFDLFTSPILSGFLVLLIIVTTLLSGLYPAFVLARFNPVAVLKNKLSYQGSSGATARKYLVVFQFLVAQVLIIGTLVVASQMSYFKSTALGFRKDAIINVGIPDTEKNYRDALVSELSSVSGIENISFSLGAPTSENTFSTSFFLTERGKDEDFEANIKPIDRNYLSTYGIELAAGRWFTEAEEKNVDQALPEADRRYTYIVNETLVRKLGFSSNEEILGKKITTGLNRINAEVVGVVKDFHMTSLHKEVNPLVLVQFPYFYFDAGIAFNTANTKETLTSIEKAFNKVFPDYLFEYTFLDQHLESLYQQEQRTFAMIKVLAVLAILISCLGLYGLVSFLTQQKMKEVGIRKVFGASVPSIVYLFSKSFIGLIITAFVLAAPIAWYAMNTWLEEFAYRTNIGVTVFLISLGSTVLIALLTVSYQSIRAAISNPVKSLRYE